MRTTVDIPDRLYREAKARAALEGMSLKELLIHSVEAHLYGAATEQKNPDSNWKLEFETLSLRLSEASRTAPYGRSALEQLQADRSRLD